MNNSWLTASEENQLIFHSCIPFEFTVRTDAIKPKKLDLCSQDFANMKTSSEMFRFRRYELYDTLTDKHWLLVTCLMHLQLIQYHYPRIMKWINSDVLLIFPSSFIILNKEAYY